MPTVTRIVRGYVRERHAEEVALIADCADAVAADWDGSATTDRGAVVDPLSRALHRAGVTDRLPAVLEGAVDAAGADLQAQPVAAPPYVVVTSAGPMLRATLPDGRLVVTFRVFAVERGADVRYRRLDGATVDVAFR